MAGAHYLRGESPRIWTGVLDTAPMLALTDPPYGTGKDGHQYGRRQNRGLKRGEAFIARDRDLSELTTVAPWLAETLHPEGVAFIFMAPTSRTEAVNILEDAGFVVPHVVIWDKGSAGISYGFRYQHEDVLLAHFPTHDPFITRGALLSMVRCPRVRDPVHPNEKPVRILRHFIRWALPTPGLIVDPFAGVASSGVAALAEGCDWYGAELDAQWWAEGEHRLD